MEMDIRPWGKYEVLLDAPNYKVKRITVKSNERLSYQYHNHRSEVWTIIEGIALWTVNGVSGESKPGQVIQIMQGRHHRVKNEKDELLIFIEVQYGTYFGEDDIVRLEDDYGRTEE